MFKVTWIRYNFSYYYYYYYDNFVCGREMVDVKTHSPNWFCFSLCCDDDNDCFWDYITIIILSLSWYSNTYTILAVYSFRRLNSFYALFHKNACLVDWILSSLLQFSLLWIWSNCEYTCVRDELPEVKSENEMKEKMEIFQTIPIWAVLNRWFHKFLSVAVVWCPFRCE